MNTAAIVFPHQLFRQPPFPRAAAVYLVEEYLFFRQYRFHKLKIALHRASMQFYARHLQAQGYRLVYIESMQDTADIRRLLPQLAAAGVTDLHLYHPDDDWLQQRILKHQTHFSYHWHEHPGILTPRAVAEQYFAGRSSYNQGDFYRQQRRRMGLLMEGDTPAGGKWSFDADNRRRYPARMSPPPVTMPAASPLWDEACAYTRTHFAGNPGNLPRQPLYPCTYADARQWLDDFLANRFYAFGAYEDSIVSRQHFLHHSVLSPLLNNGLLEPGAVLAAALDYAVVHQAPLNSVEGFVRQLTGWREYVHGVYTYAGRAQRNANFWQHRRPIPRAFYEATTGIPPVDQSIKKLLHTGYLHHIERLMVLANFMNLCGFAPHAVYQWFMELFIDAYDWVMVPNIYGMSLYADGGLMSTKPYISGSNYLLQMSDYARGSWTTVWDALYWQFIARHTNYFEAQPRLSMMAANWARMDAAKKTRHLQTAQDFLSGW